MSPPHACSPRDAEFGVFRVGEGFGEDVSGHVGCVYILEFDLAQLYPFTDEVVLNVNVFGMGVEGWVFGEGNGSGIVVPDLCGVLGVPKEFNYFA